MQLDVAPAVAIGGPCQLKLDVLRQFSVEQNPLGGGFDYGTAFAKLDCKSFYQMSDRIDPNLQ